MEEIWKNIEEDPRYQVSNLGRVKGLKGQFMTPTPDKKGYHRVTFWSIGTKKLHRLVAGAFISNPDNLPQVNHKNGIKTDNCVSNLEWCTNYHNAHHAMDNGLHVVKRGSDHGMSQISEEDVRLIRFLRKKGLPRKQLMKEFGVSIHVIKDVISKRSWIHV